MNHDNLTNELPRFDVYTVQEYNEAFGTNYQSAEDAIESDPEYIFDEIESNQWIAEATIEFHQNQIKNSKELFDLMESLNDFEGWLRREAEQYDVDGRIDSHIDLSDLPNYGPEPRDTADVWSYDHDDVIVYKGNIWTMEPRCPQCSEADFHCDCWE